MKTNLTFTIILLFFGLQFSLLTCSAQTWTWAQSNAGNGTTGAWSCAADTNGNVFVTGLFSSNITFGATILTNGGGDDIFVVKYDKNGNVLWAQSAGTTGSNNVLSICADDSGNAFITGYFASTTITFGSFTLTTSGGNNRCVYVVKYNGAAGNVDWALSPTQTSAADGMCVCPDNNGSVFVSGWNYGNITFSPLPVFTNTAGFSQNYFLVKINTGTGVPSWGTCDPNHSGGGGDEAGTSLSFDKNGNLYMTGYYVAAKINFGTGTLTLNNPSGGGSSHTFYVVKYSSTGNPVWAQTISGTVTCSNTNYALGISVDNLGNSYIAGAFCSPNITFGALPTLTNTGSGDNVFVVKYDSSGNALWAKSAGSGNTDDEGWNVSVATPDNIYVTGYFTSPSISFDATTLYAPAGSSGPQFIVQFDSSGNVICDTAIASNNDNWRNGLCTDKQGNAYIAGDYNVNPLLLGSISLPLSGTEDAFVGKYAGCGASESPPSPCDNIIYCFGGYNTGSNYLNINYAYNTATNTWQSEAPVPTAADDFGAAAVSNIIYCMGGSDGSTTALDNNYGYNSTNNSWNNSLATVPTTAYSPGVAVVGNKVYCIAGVDNTGALLSSNYAYNTTNNSWDTLAPMPTASVRLGTAAAANKIYCIGGWNGNSSLSGNYAYNTVNNTWDTLAPIPTAAEWFAEVAVGNIIYCIGGVTGNGGTPLTNNYAYNITTNTWDTTLAPIPTACFGSGVAAVGNIIYCVGGANNGGVLTNNYAYNTTTNTWITEAPIPIPTVGLAAAAIIGINTSIRITPADTSICSGGPVLLTATGGTTYLWSNGAVTDTITVNPTADTSFIVMVSNSGCTGIDTSVIAVKPVEPLVIQPPFPSVCPGQSITLSVPVSGDDYNWSPSSTLNSSTGDTVVATPSVTTTYTVNGTDSLGCTVSASDEVIVSSTPDTPTITRKGDDLISSATQGNQWVRNDTVLNGATNQTYFAAIPGSYQVIAENPANGCSSKSAPYNFTTGIEQLSVESGQLIVYPNPTGGEINVTISSSVGELKDWNLQVTDVLGRTVYTMSPLNSPPISSEYMPGTFEIDLSNLSSGVYFICVIDKTGRVVVPVVKQ